MFLKKHWTFFEKHWTFSKKQRYVFFDTFYVQNEVSRMPIKTAFERCFNSILMPCY